MLEWKEANPLPQRCIECEEKAKAYAAADEAEKLRMELEEDFFFDSSHYLVGKLLSRTSHGKCVA